MILAVVAAGALGAWWITDRDPDSTSRWLFSHTAGGGILKQNPDGSYTLTLDGIDSHVVAFTDRPMRDVDILDVSELVRSWPELFAGSAPNAVLVEHNPLGEADSVVLTLGEPSLTTNPRDGLTSLIFQATVLRDELPESLVALSGGVHSTLPSRFDQVSLFIDDAASDSLGRSVAVGESVESVLQEEQEEQLITEEREEDQIKEEEKKKSAEQSEEEGERKDLTQDFVPSSN